MNTAVVACFGHGGFGLAIVGRVLTVVSLREPGPRSFPYIAPPALWSAPELFVPFLIPRSMAATAAVLPSMCAFDSVRTCRAVAALIGSYTTLRLRPGAVWLSTAGIPGD